MTSSEKSTGLLAVLAKSLTVYGHAQTQVHLGDRSTYIGLSDIGKGDECLRSAVASKLAPAKATGAEQFNARSDLNAIMPVLRKQLTLQRGHWQEAGIENALNHSGYKIIPQLTIKVKYQDVPI